MAPRQRAPNRVATPPPRRVAVYADRPRPLPHTVPSTATISPTAIRAARSATAAGRWTSASGRDARHQPPSAHVAAIGEAFGDRAEAGGGGRREQAEPGRPSTASPRVLATAATTAGACASSSAAVL